MNRFIHILPTVPALAATCAASQCLDYEPESIVLSGVLTSEVHPGPPNFESIDDGDQPETIWVMTLDAPICIRESGERNPAEQDVESVQVSQSRDRYGRYGRLSGSRVSIAGRLTHANSVQQRRAIFLDVDEIRSAAGVQDPSPEIDARAAQILVEHVPGFRLAARSDFIAELRDNPYVTSATQAVVAADFDQDDADDLAIVAISETRPEYRIYYAIADEDGYRLDLLLTRELPAASSDGIVRNGMFLKAVGEQGVAGRSYANIAGNPLDPDNFTQEFGRERAARTREYESVPAIEVWTGPALIDSGDGRNVPDDGVMYCSTTWYYRQNDELATFGACD